MSRVRPGGSERGRSARQRSRPRHPAAGAILERHIPPYEMLEADALERIESHADRLLAEIGMEVRGDEQALALWREAGARIDGARVRVPDGLARDIVRRSAPASFVQHARNPARSVRIGGRATVLAPAYGSPFVSDVERGRRYGTLEDFH